VAVVAVVAGFGHGGGPGGGPGGFGVLPWARRCNLSSCDNMRLRLKHHVAALNWTFHSTVYNHSRSSDTSNDLGIWRDDKRSATHITLYLTVDLN
jgi:hypothetical protein